MTTIKFGTDGWRAIIADEYTVDNVARVAFATAQWLKQNSAAPSLVLGHDCRFGGPMFVETVAKVMAGQGVKILVAKGFVSTPMVSFGAWYYKATAGVIITASHNPPDYNGFKIKSGLGGPASPAEIAAVEALIPEKAEIPAGSLDALLKSGNAEEIDLESLYIEQVNRSFDINLINDSGITVAFDAMYGSGQNVIRKLLKNAVLLHCEVNPGFNGVAPEPLHKNLLELSATVAKRSEIDCGLATDGDADRIAMYNQHGQYVDAHHIILLLIHYLHKYKGMTGKVVVAFSVSDKVKKLCKAYGLPLEVTKIGFKYICEYMVREDVLVGGEESGGIAVKGHIPERDGIWDGLVLLEFMAKTGKSLSQLIEEVYAIVGPFSYNRNDLRLTEEKKQAIIANCQNGVYKNFGSYPVEEVADIDGFKYYLPNDQTIMIRPSGTEPVLRVYAEGPTPQAVEQLLAAAKETLLG